MGYFVLAILRKTHKPQSTKFKDQDQRPMNVLVLNCGSSSVKFQLIATDLEQIAHDGDHRLARGNIERIGGEAIVTLQAEGRGSQRSTAALRDTRATVDLIVHWACAE